ncbi:MAG TPA: metalloregulator ArsR/SmtB family transcription factor [Chthonomonadaceae bacterium]|nr:metalloregulator ArsR/SmtB family transcription factor [Chthonomonadaceae bacterium]
MPDILERNIEEITCEAYNDDPTRVRRVARVMPDDDAFETASVLLKAIADPVRARILYALTLEPLCVCELATLLAMSMSAVSHHLKVLTLSGLLKVKKEGKFACYYFKDEHLANTLVTLVRDLTKEKAA